MQLRWEWGKKKCEKMAWNVEKSMCVCLSWAAVFRWEWHKSKHDVCFTGCVRFAGWWVLERITMSGVNQVIKYSSG